MQTRLRTTTEIGERIAELLCDVPRHSAWAAIKIASALVEERDLNEVSGPVLEQHQSDSQDFEQSASATG